MIVKWYAIAIIVYAVLMAFWILSGSNFYNMVINMIAGLSGLLTIIIVIEVLKRKSSSTISARSRTFHHGS